MLAMLDDWLAEVVQSPLTEQPVPEPCRVRIELVRVSTMAVSVDMARVTSVFIVDCSVCSVVPWSDIELIMAVRDCDLVVPKLTTRSPASSTCVSGHEYVIVDT